MCGGFFVCLFFVFFPESRTSRQLDPLFPDFVGSAASQGICIGSYREGSCVWEGKNGGKRCFYLD